MKMLKIPAIYREIEQVILIPSYSIAQHLAKELNNCQIKLTTGPLLADCYRPHYFTTEFGKNLIISQFIGATGPNYIINLLHEHNLKRVLFLGSAATYRDKIDINSKPDAKPCLPSRFYPCHNSLGTCDIIEKPPFALENFLLKRDLQIPLNLEDAVSSINQPTYFIPDLVARIYKDTSIHVFDMESAFIAEHIKNLGISFGCLLFITDHHQVAATGDPTVIQASKSLNFKEILKYLVGII